MSHTDRSMPQNCRVERTCGPLRSADYHRQSFSECPDSATLARHLL